MNVEPLGVGWNQPRQWILLRHCGPPWKEVVNSVFLRLPIRCPECDEVGMLEPDQIVAIFGKYDPPPTCQEADRADDFARARTTLWYRGFEIPGAEIAEYEVFPVLLRA